MSFPLKMVIFHSYVSLPEGIVAGRPLDFGFLWPREVPLRTPMLHLWKRRHRNHQNPTSETPTGFPSGLPMSIMCFPTRWAIFHRFSESIVDGPSEGGSAKMVTLLAIPVVFVVPGTAWTVQLACEFRRDDDEKWWTRIDQHLFCLPSGYLT